MIKLTYRIICDICQKDCSVEEYDCTNYLTGVFQRPSGLFTYQINGIAEMCDDCAAPIAQAKHEVIQAYIKRRSQSE